MTRMKWPGLLALTTLVLFGLAACSPAAPPAQPTSGPAKAATASGEQVTLQYLDFTLGDMPQEKEYIDQFMKEHPNIKIDLQTIDVNGLHDKLLVAAKSKTAPDVFQSLPEWTVEMALANVQMPLDDFINAEGAEFKSQYIPQALMLGAWKGKTYAMPWRFGGQAVFVNKKLLDAAGVKIPDKWTWDDFISVAQKLTDPSKNQYGVGIALAKPSRSAVYTWLPFLFTAGGHLVDNNQPVFNSPNGVEAAKFFVGLVNQYKVAPPESFSFANKDVVDAFGNNRVAMFANGPWYIATVKKAYPNTDFEVYPLPTKSAYASSLSGTTLGISPQSQHPKEAWEFVKFMTSKATLQAWAKSGGFVPANKGSLDDPYFKQKPMSVFVDVSQQTGSQVVGVYPEGEKIFEALYNGLQEIALRNKDPKAALDDAAATWKSVLGSY